MKIDGALARWLTAFGYWLLQVWARTMRYEIEDRAGVLAQPPSERFIGALWHNRLLLLPYLLKRFAPHRQGAALISASRDGNILADLVQRFGFDVVRGSSSRQGATAMRKLTEVLASGRDVVITPDGPRGPAYQLGPGLPFLSQKSAVAVVPLSIEYSSYWRLKSWDRFFLPRPFSTVRFILGPPHLVPPTATDEELETERLRLQNAMMEIVETV